MKTSATAAISKQIDPSIQLLVAAPQLTDPFFAKSVILMIQHNDNGAFGLIINKPSDVNLREIIFWEENFPLPEGLRVWFGGPVSPQSGIILEHRPDLEALGQNPFHLSTNKSSLQKLSKPPTDLITSSNTDDKESTAENKSSETSSPIPLDDQGLPRSEVEPSKDVSGAQTGAATSPEAITYPFNLRFILGYASWEPEQLEHELLRGHWIQIPFSKELVFNTPPEKIWDHAYLSLGMSPENLAPAPHHYLN